MEKEKKPISVFTLLILLVVGIGLITALSLVQRQQELRGKAQSFLGNAFEVEGEGVARVSEDTWVTKSLDITIRVTNLEQLSQE